jgi:hypothetical protein
VEREQTQCFTSTPRRRRARGTHRDLWVSNRWPFTNCSSRVRNRRTLFGRSRSTAFWKNLKPPSLSALAVALETPVAVLENGDASVKQGSKGDTAVKLRTEATTEPDEAKSIDGDTKDEYTLPHTN